MNIREFRAWDKIEKVMLTLSPISAYHGCDCSDGQVRHSKRAIMTWTGDCFEDGTLQQYIMMQYTGLKTSQGRVEKIFEDDLLKYKGKLWKVEYWEDYAGYMLVRNEAEFGENEDVSLNCDVAFESDLMGNIYLNPEVMATEKKITLESKENLE